MTAFTSTGTLTSVVSTCSGALTIPVMQSAREKIRAALAYGILNTITKANGYYNNIGEVFVKNVSFMQRKKFPSVSVVWANENYLNSIAGNHTIHMYEKQATLIIEGWFQAIGDDTDMALEKEKFIADIEKYFGTNYYIPDANGARTVFSCMLDSNIQFGGDAEEPNGGVTMFLNVYYRTPLTNPNSLV